MIRKKIKQGWSYTFTDDFSENCLLCDSDMGAPSIWLGLQDDHVTADGDVVSPLMKLDQDQVAELLPLLTYFVEHGSLPTED